MLAEKLTTELKLEWLTQAYGPPHDIMEESDGWQSPDIQDYFQHDTSPEPTMRPQQVPIPQHSRDVPPPATPRRLNSTQFPSVTRSNKVGSAT